MIVIEHPFKPRVIYRDGVTPVALEDQCGVYLDAMINSSVYDPVYCNQPRQRHAAELVTRGDEIHRDGDDPIL